MERKYLGKTFMVLLTGLPGIQCAQISDVFRIPRTLSGEIHTELKHFPVISFCFICPLNKDKGKIFLDKMEGYSQEGLLQQAQHVWSMLDEMAVSDPQAYKEFIKKHTQEGMKYLTSPEPHMCVQSIMTKHKKKMPIFINYCSWERIPPQESTEDPVKVAGCELEEEEDKEYGRVAVISLAFNPQVLKKYGRDAENELDRKVLIEIGIMWIEQVNKHVKISQNFTLLDADVPYKGSLQRIHESFRKSFTTPQDKQFEKDLSHLEENFGPLATAKPGTLLNQLANITVSNNPSEKVTAGTSSKPEIILPMENKKVESGLIQEMSNKANSLPKPQYQLEWTKGDNLCVELLTLTILLPGVKSVSECELEISQDDIILHVPDMYELHLDLPNAICDEEVTAKFNKKNSTLTVTMMPV
ncbi:hypothetical protein CHS0354_004275 [Potamilus streckersoni]|uniref:PIH1 domain-containing protein 2 n=1 Tax=Potamilus streckersoni TaxID=2493646 RepID=A0AAE0S4D3_9BIVA|nr:hypothetical protein CHS0354_004275 [Potamilus streckersoni]